MTDFVSPLNRVFRHSSSTSANRSSASASPGSNHSGSERRTSRSSGRLSRGKRPSFDVPVYEEDEEEPPQLPPSTSIGSPQSSWRDTQGVGTASRIASNLQPETGNPRVTVEQATPERRRSSIRTADIVKDSGRLGEVDASSPRPTIATRRRSPISMSNSRLFPSSQKSTAVQGSTLPTNTTSHSTPGSMPHRRKIWVRRAGAAATQVMIGEEDLVDDVKDMVLKKYANSLGRNFDPPDVTLKVVGGGRSARQSSERVLGADENMMKMLSLHYPSGQSMEEALVIDVPQRRTPKHSPRVAMPYHLSDDFRPRETGSDYFPPMPLAGPNSPHLPTSVSVTSGHGSIHRPPTLPHSISVIETGQLPNLPSPGSRMTRHSGRPRYGRQPTSSPTVLNGGPHSQNIENLKSQNTPAVPTPPIPTDILAHRSATPPRTQSPRPKPDKRHKKAIEPSPAMTGLLDGAVPPINVLIVEDNIINLKLLEAFLKRLKVRWSTAMNGEIAVQRWREGGFHLVLMDIQLPVMNGLEATKEIRRLERVNNIGVFSSSAGSTPTFSNGTDGDGLNGPAAKGEDNLMNTELFKSPVIIVALTASSLQSDRHEALAAGCNDFLTKPVNFDWLSRKVMEWGCMQALIDFDGWRKWKDFSQTPSIPLIAKTTPSKPLHDRTTTTTTAAAAAASTAANGGGSAGGGATAATGKGEVKSPKMGMNGRSESSSADLGSGEWGASSGTDSHEEEERGREGMGGEE